MSQGWISIHRKIQSHWLYEENRKFSKFEAWIDLLLLANHQDRKILLGNQLVDVKRGSFITSDLKLMNRWSWSKTKVRKFLSVLEKDEMITRNPDKKKTIITICNYNDYQKLKTTENPEKDLQETTAEPEEDTNNNDDNDLSSCDDPIESLPLEPAKYDEESVHYKAALYIRSKVLKINPKCKVPKDNPEALEKWADTIRLTIERDKRTIEEMRQIVEFVFEDDFWCTVVQSPTGLRKNWDKIWVKMQKSHKFKSKGMSYNEQMDVLKEWANDE